MDWFQWVNPSSCNVTLNTLIVGTIVQLYCSFQNHSNSSHTLNINTLKYLSNTQPFWNRSWVLVIIQYGIYTWPPTQCPQSQDVVPLLLTCVTKYQDNPRSTGTSLSSSIIICSMLLSQRFFVSTYKDYVTCRFLLTRETFPFLYLCYNCSHFHTRRICA